jgi:hypothetical protein
MDGTIKIENNSDEPIISFVMRESEIEAKETNENNS